MSGKKHPILLALVIIGATLLFLGTVMALVLTLFGPTSKLSFGEKIGVIPIEGAILNSERIVTQLVDFREDENIRAIILRIDSPGGGVGPSQEVYREVRKTIKTKKVFASMGSVAASGGYYIAAAANKIIANPGTITGSIGVIVEFVQLQDLLKKIGVGMEVLKSGEFKDVGSPHRKMSDRDRALVQDLISDIQGQFVKAVAQGRGLSEDKVMEIADGRIISGAQAKEFGLIDVLGNFRDAVELAKRAAEIEGEPTLVYPDKPGSRLWDLLFDDAAKVFKETIRKSLKTRIEYRWDGYSH